MWVEVKKVHFLKLAKVSEKVLTSYLSHGFGVAIIDSGIDSLLFCTWFSCATSGRLKVTVYANIDSLN